MGPRGAIADLDDEVEPRGQIQPDGPRKMVCPECPEILDKPEDLSVHLVRHEEVWTPANETERLQAYECPKKCGRWFSRKKYGVAKPVEYRAHISMCDGSKPLVAAPRVDESGKENDVAKKPKATRSKFKWFCDDHNFGTNGPRAWGDHQVEKHGAVRRGRKPRASTTDPEGELQETPLMRAQREANERRDQDQREAAAGGAGEANDVEPVAKEKTAIDLAIEELEGKKGYHQAKLTELDETIAKLKPFSVAERLK